MISIDYSVSIGTMAEVVIFVTGGIYALGMLRATVISLKEEVEEVKTETKDSLSGVQQELKKIGDILVNQADMNRRIIHLEDDVRELRHGRGFIQGEHGIDREFP